MANSVINSSMGMLPQKNNSIITSEMLQQFKQFKNTFRGNPKQQVMNMVKQGMRSNQQLQQAMNMAQQIQGFLK